MAFRYSPLVLVTLGVIALLGVSGAPASAQATGTIQGVVLQAGSGQPVSTIQVFLSGSTQGALTDAAGKYQLVGVAAGQVEVTVQGIGYRKSTQTATVTAGGTTRLDFTMSLSAVELDEVVVTGTGQATQVKKLGNTVASIKTADIESASVSSMSEVLQGREPGVVAVPTGGVAGEGMNIRIRGGSSLSQSNQPIIIVDGVRVDNGGGMGGLDQGGGSPSRLDDINPESIERVEILKGAAAATLYGTEASNGVIQIFTKAGSAGAARWSMNIERGISNYPVSRYQPHAGFARTQEQADQLSQYWGQDIQPFQVFEVNMWPQLFETGTNTTTSLAVNGGNDNVTYYLSGRYQGENGPFRNDGFGAAAPGMTQVSDLNSKKQASANLTFSPSSTIQVRTATTLTLGHLEVPANNNNIYGTISDLTNSKPERASEVNPTGAVPSFGSIREMMYRRTFQDVQHFFGTIGTRFTPSSELTADLTFGADIVSEQNVFAVPFGWNVDGLSGATPEGTRTVRDRNEAQYSVDAKTAWNTNFSTRVSSAFVLGGQAYYRKDARAGGVGTRFAGPGLDVIGAAADVNVYEQRFETVSAGVFAQEQVGFDNYLFLTVGARYDKHSAFGETAGGALYPKVSISFVPSDLPSWPKSDLVSSLRLRAALGQSGLQPNAFDKFTTFSPITSQTGAGVEPGNLGNQDLKPEISTEFETGFDLGLFNDRISVTTSYWNRTVTDALVPRQFALSGGFTATQLDNIGELKAHGLEVGLSGTVLSTPKVSLDLFANAAYLYQEVTSLSGAPPIKLGYYRYGNWIKEGYAPGAFFGPKLVDAKYPIDQNGDGVPDSEAELAAYFSQPRDPSVINTLTSDVDGDGDHLDNYLGKPIPDWTGAVGGTLSFLGNFKIRTLFEYKAGNYQVHNLTNEFRRSNALIGRNIKKSAETESILLNPASTTAERVEAARVWATQLASLSPQDRLNAIEDADFIRWRELSVTYQMPRSLIDRFGMSRLDVTLGGRNIALWTKYSGVDPEVNVIGGRDPSDSAETSNFLIGVEGWDFAIPRRLTLSLDIGF